MKQIKDILEPQPSLAILHFWQGKGEIILRATCIGLCCVLFICAAVTSTHTAFPDIVSPPVTNQTILNLQTLRDGTHGVSGWVIFLCLVGIVYEAIFITLRFLNLSVLDTYIGVALITDIVVDVIFSLSWFIAGIVLATFGGTQWPSVQDTFAGNTIVNNVDFASIESSCLATGVIALLFALPVYITLTVWTGVWLGAKWQQHVTRILRNQAGPTDQYTEDLDPSEEDY